MEAVLDAPGIDTGLDTGVENTPDTAVEIPGVETPEEAIEEEAPEGEQEGAAAAPRVITPAIVDGKLSADVKKTLDELHATNPVLAKQLKEALYRSADVDKLFPGGVKELRDFHQKLDELGGFEGIGKSADELQWFNDLDQQFTQADPKFVEQLIATPEGQAAFVRLAPQMLSTLNQLHPETYSSIIARSFVATMGTDLPIQLMRLQDLVADNPKATEVLGQVMAWVDNIKQHAAKQVAPPASKAPAPDRGSELDQREARLTAAEWKTSADESAKKTFDTEYAALSKGRNVTDQQRAAIVELYQSRVSKILSADSKFNSTAQRHFETRNKDGYLRHVASAYEKAIPQALRQAMDAILPARPGPKPNGNGAAPKPIVKPGTPEAGFSRVANRPAPMDIDPERSTTEMISAGKAILRNGNKVQWR